MLNKLIFIFIITLYNLNENELTSNIFLLLTIEEEENKTYQMQIVSVTRFRDL